MAIRKKKGGLRGWLDYSSKSLDGEGVTRRSRYFNDEGKARVRKLRLTPAQKRELQEIIAAVSPHEAVVLVGIRRFKGRYSRVEVQNKAGHVKPVTCENASRIPLKKARIPVKKPTTR